MTAASGDPVPAIPEDQAQGEIAALYDDMRATLGVPVVNLIWRHLATFPGGLAWAWGSVKPHYVSGAVKAEALALRDGLALADLPAWPPAVLRAAGVSAEDAVVIGRILDTYERGNAMNLIALTALHQRIQRVGPAEMAPPPAGPTRSEPPIESRLPVLLALREMAPDTAQLVADMNRLGQPGEGRIVASLYRHLAHWPGFLALAWALIAPLAADGRLAAMIRATRAEAQARASPIAAALACTTAESPAAVRVGLDGAIAEFVDHAISRMLPIGAQLRRAMPRADGGV